MLAKLSIKNVALIENAEISFSKGLNVLSGETGAGKSVILDSVNFVLGAKADRSMIRYGQSECLVKAEFLLNENAMAVQILREMDIDSDGEIIVSRKFNLDGKNSIKINGNTVTATMLRSVTDHLVDVHGQSEHFFLLKEANQLKMLDLVIGEELISEKTALKDLLIKLSQIKEEISMLGGNEQDRNRRLDVLKYQIDEIAKADIHEGEEEELQAKRIKILHLEKIISSLHETISCLTDERGVVDSLRYAKRAMSSISNFDSQYSSILDRLESLCLEAEDLSETLSGQSDDLYFDEDEARNIEERLDIIRDLKRKYGADYNEIIQYYNSIQKEYELLSNCEEKYAELSVLKEKTEREIYLICEKITSIRKKCGKAFCDRVIEELKSLNIPHAAFSIEFNEYSFEDIHCATSNGLDRICFYFSANAGEPLKPLGKIISGGEMSRFMLAIKTQFSGVNDICTYLFDEIDAGISGKTAKVVGEKFAAIAKKTQIIAVSHLAQIAVMSDKEFLIEKYEEAEKTYTKVLSLDDKQKTSEIIRLLGGNVGDEYAERHAYELLKQAQDFKASLP